MVIESFGIFITAHLNGKRLENVTSMADKTAEAIGSVAIFSPYLNGIAHTYCNEAA